MGLFVDLFLGQVVTHPLARPLLPLIPTTIRSFIISSSEAEALLEDYDSAAHYLANWGEELKSRLSGKSSKNNLSDNLQVDHTRDYEVLAVSEWVLWLY